MPFRMAASSLALALGSICSFPAAAIDLPTNMAPASTSSIGERARVLRLPANLAVAKKAPTGAAEISGNTAGRVANKGMEGLAITPDGKTLFGFVQSPLIEDGGDGGRADRIVKVDIRTGATAQYVYDNYLVDESKAYNSSELLALKGDDDRRH